MQPGSLTASHFQLCTINKLLLSLLSNMRPRPPGAATKSLALLPSMATCMQTYLQPGHHRGTIPGGEGQALAAGFLQQVVSEESGSEFSTHIFV